MNIHRNIFLKKAFFAAIILISLFVSFQGAQAAGLIPCGGKGESACTICHLVIGIFGIVDYFFKIVFYIGLAVFAIAGVMYTVSAGDTGLIDKAKGAMKNAGIGIIVVFSSWIIVNYSMQLLGTKADLGIGVAGWNKFECRGELVGASGATGVQPGTNLPSGSTWKGTYNANISYAEKDAVLYNGSSYVATKTVPVGKLPTDANYWNPIVGAGTTVPSSTGGGATCSRSNEIKSGQPVCSGGCSLQTCINKVKADPNYVSLIAKYASGKENVIIAIIAKESCGKADAINPFSGACGLMQILPVISNCSDPETNIKKGVEIFNQKLAAVSGKSYGGGITKEQMAFAAYNCCANEDNPNSQSASCQSADGWPALPKWACPLDPGTGSYNMCTVRDYSCQISACI